MFWDDSLSAAPTTSGSTRGPQTVPGKMLRAIARRDFVEFRHWRSVMHRVGNDGLGPILTSAFRSVVVRRFPPGTDRRDIIRFAMQPRQPLSSTVNLNPLEAEAYIRTILGEPDLIGDLSGRRLSDLAMQYFVFIVEDMGLGDEELDSILAKAEQFADSTRE